MARSSPVRTRFSPLRLQIPGYSAKPSPISLTSRQNPPFPVLSREKPPKRPEKLQESAGIREILGPWEAEEPRKDRRSRTVVRKREAEGGAEASLQRKRLSPQTGRENEVRESFQAVLSLCDSYRDGSRSPVLSRISGTEKLMRKYADVRNYLTYLPQVSGQKVPFAPTTQYLGKYKLIRDSEIIDKETASDCVESFFRTTAFITKRFGKPKMWRHSGRIIPSKAANGLLGYGSWD